MPDNFNIIKDANSTTYNFENTNVTYAAKFTLLENKNISNIMVPNKGVMNIILNIKNKYNVDFGILTTGGISDNIQTNKYNTVLVINNVCAIIKDFINKNDVEIIMYYATGKRDSIYKYVYDKYMKNDFTYYTAKEKPFYDRFLIRKDLIK